MFGYGYFQQRPYIDGIERELRHMDPDLAKEIRVVYESLYPMNLNKLGDEIEKNFKGKLTPAQERAFKWNKCADPSDLIPILALMYSASMESATI